MTNIFPLVINRTRELADLRFNDRPAIGKFVKHEIKSWEWLEDSAENKYFDDANTGLLERVRERQLHPFMEIEYFVVNKDKDITNEDEAEFAAWCDRYLKNGLLLTNKDTATQKILSAKESAPDRALGMLAQALNIPITEESAVSFAGRIAWSIDEPATLRQGVESKLAELDRQLDQIRNRNDSEELNKLTGGLLESLRIQKEETRYKLLFLIRGLLGALVCSTLIFISIHFIFEDVMKVTWYVTIERFSFYFFAAAVFFWVFRLIGKFLLDTWNTSQSLEKRIANLSLVLKDEGGLLIRLNENGERVVEEIFGDKYLTETSESTSLTDMNDLLKTLTESVKNLTATKKSD